MKYLFGFLLAAGLVLALSGPIAERLQDSNAYERQRQALELARQRDALERQRSWEAATAPANVALYYGGAAGGLVFFGLVLAFLRDGKARRTRAFELVDVQGYPLARRQLEESEGWTLELMARALELDKAAKLAEASRALPPHTLTYAPKMSGHDAPALVDTAAAALATAPSFADLLARGEIGQGRPLVLGYSADGTPLRGSWLDLYSTAVGGLPGSGKTTSQRFLAAQSALHGCSFVIVDKHADAADDSLAATLAPLSSIFRCEVASTEKSILEAVRLVADIGEKRIRGKDTSRTPVILWVDEATALLAHSRIGDELAALLEQIAQQYRKRAVYASISGQIWTADRAGSSALRDSLCSVLAHRMKRNQARLLVPTDEAVLVERLAPGHALLWRTSGQSEVITMPNTTAGDIRQVAGLLTGSASTMDRLQSGSNVAPDAVLSQLLGVKMESEWSRNGAGSSAIGRGEPLSAESARVLGLFCGGADISAIVRELYGVTSANGSKYQRLAGEVQTLLRQALQQ